MPLPPSLPTSLRIALPTSLRIALQARAHVLERFREDAHGNFYNPDELAAETEELFGKSFEQARHPAHHPRRPLHAA